MTKLVYIGIKDDNAPFRVVNNALMTDELNNLQKGRYRLTIEKYRKAKSNPQLGYLFGAVYPMALQALNEAGWEFVSIDQVDAFFKSQFANQELLNKHTGEIMNVPSLKREMTTTELSTFTNAVRDWCSEYLSYYIPEPEENLTIQYDENSKR